MPGTDWAFRTGSSGQAAKRARSSGTVARLDTLAAIDWILGVFALAAFAMECGTSCSARCSAHSTTPSITISVAKPTAISTRITWSMK